MSDILVAPVWLGVTLGLVWAAGLVGQRLFPHDAFGPRLMHTTVLSWACIVGVATSLGSVGWLSPGFLLAGVSVIAGLAWWRCRRAQRALKTPMVNVQSSGLQMTVTESMAAPPASMPLFPYAWLALWGFALAWAVSWTVWRGLLEYPSDWDTLNYHLPLIVQWLHRGNLYAPDDANWFVLGNNELLGLWLVGPFSGDFLIALINLPAVLLLAAGTVELARNLGMAGSWRHVAALAILSTWPVHWQLTDVENDVAVAGLFVAVLAYMLRYSRQGKRADLILAAISLGLLTGVKYYALGYACVAGLGLVFLVLALRGVRTTGLIALVLALGVCLWGGYWYVRNLWVTGSPIYPQGIMGTEDPLRQMRTLAGQTPFWQTSLLGNARPELFPLLLRAVWRMSGPCQATACLLLPVTLVWLIASGIWRCCHAESSGSLRLTLAFWLVAAGLIWSVTPFTAEDVTTLDSVARGYHPIRYGLCFLSLCVLGFVLAADDLIQGLRRLLQFAIDRAEDPRMSPTTSRRHFVPAVLDTTMPYLTLSAFGVGVAYQYSGVLRRVLLRGDLLDPSLLAVDLWLTGCIVVLLWFTVPRLRRIVITTLTIGLMIGAPLTTVWLSDHWHSGFAAHYNSTYRQPVFTSLEKVDISITCVCTMSDRYYPFFGSRRQWHICRPYWVPSYKSLLDYLHNHEATLVVALQNDYSGVHSNGSESDWLRGHPELFPLIEDGADFFVCRVNRLQLARALEGK